MKTAHQNVPTAQTGVDATNKSYVDTAVSGATVAIGSTLTGGTPGSLLFVNTGPILAQNNNRLFWDNTNARLGIGTNLPGSTLDLVGASNTAAMSFFGGSAAAVGVAGTGRLRFNEGTNKLQVSLNGAAYADILTGTAGTAIGTTVTGGTAGSLLFVGSGPVLAQDNANLFWDATNFRLGIGMNAPTTTLDLFTTGSATAVAFAAGSSAGVSGVGKGRIRYNELTTKFQVSVNGGAYADIATGSLSLAIGSPISGATSGSVLFADASSNLAQDNAAFQWVDSAKVLKLTQSAADPADGTGALTLQNTLNTSVVQITWRDHLGTFHAALGYANAGGSQPLYLYCDNSGAGLGYQGPGGSSAQIYAGVANQAGIQLWNGSSLGVSAASTGRLIYNTTGQKFQMSANAGSYLDVALLAAALTTGSVPFADSSGHLAQNNANFNWNNSTNTLSITGGSSSSFALDIHGLDTSGNFDTVRIANNVAGFGLPVLQFDDKSVFIGGIIGYSVGGSFGLVKGITTAVPSGMMVGIRQGASVNSSIIAQFDATNTYLNAANTSLGHQNASTYTVDIRGSRAAGGNCRIQNTDITGYSTWDIYDNGGSVVGAVGHGNASVALTHLQNKNYLYTTGVNWTIVTASAALFTFDMTNARLGIGSGNVTPGAALDVFSTAGGADAAAIRNTSASGYSSIAYSDSSGVLKFSSGYANASAPDPKTAGRAFLHYEADMTFATTTSNNAYFNVSNGFIGLGIFDGATTTPQTRVHVYGSENPTIVRIQSTAAPGSGRFEFYSDPITSANQWRPGYFQSEDEGSFTGSVVFYTNGTSSANKFGSVEAGRFTNGSLQMAAGSAATVAPASRGKLRYNESTQKMQTSFNTLSYYDLPQLESALTTGSVPFANSSGRLDQNNTKLFWDNTNFRFGIGTGSPTLNLDVRGSNAGANVARLTNADSTGFSGIEFWDTGTALQTVVGFANASSTVTHIASKGFWYSATSVNFVYANATKNEFTFGMTDGSTFLEQANGSSAAVSSANTGRLIYTTTGQKYQVSANGAAYLDVALLAAALTTGSIPFADSSGHLAQNNSKFFWDNTNFRLGIRTTSPAHALDVQGGNINLKTHTGYTGSDVVTSTFAVQTTTATTLDTTIFTMADTTVFRVIYEVLGRDEAGVERAFLGRAALVYRQGGGATIQTENTTFNDIHTNPSMNAAVTVSTNDVRISITGLAATTIDWVVHMRYQALATSA